MADGTTKASALNFIELGKFFTVCLMLPSAFQADFAPRRCLGGHLDIVARIGNIHLNVA